MVTATDLLDIHAARGGGTLLRYPFHGVERLLLVGVVLGALRDVPFTQLAFVERDLARQAVAGVAELAVENIAVVFGEEGAWSSMLVSRNVKDWLEMDKPQVHSAFGQAWNSSSCCMHFFAASSMYLDRVSVIPLKSLLLKTERHF